MIYLLHLFDAIKRQQLSRQTQTRFKKGEEHMPKVRVGIVGAGFGGQVHVPGFKAASNTRVIGIASRRHKNALKIATLHSLPRCFRTWQELVQSPDIDAVSIATPPDSHCEIALAAIRAGKAVLCEKPLATSAKESKKMLEAARKEKVVAMVEFEFRELKAFCFAKSFIDEGKLGKVRHVNINWISKNWTNPHRPWTWRSVHGKGGGAIGALGVHAFDYLQWLLGPISSVVANMETCLPKRPGSLGQTKKGASEDCCQLIMKLCDKTPVNMTLSAIAPSTRGHWLEIFGEKKVLIVGSHHPTDYFRGFNVWLAAGEANLTREKLKLVCSTPRLEKDSRLLSFKKVAQKFVDAVLAHDTNARPSFEDGDRAQRVIEAVFNSHRMKRWNNV